MESCNTILTNDNSLVHLLSITQTCIPGIKWLHAILLQNPVQDQLNHRDEHTKFVKTKPKLSYTRLQ